jgi:hypothetical protein
MIDSTPGLVKTGTRGRPKITLEYLETKYPQISWSDSESLHRFLWIKYSNCSSETVFTTTQVEKDYGLTAGALVFVCKRLAAEKRGHIRKWRCKLVDPDEYERKMIKKLGCDAPHLPVLF